MSHIDNQSLANKKSEIPLKRGFTEALFYVHTQKEMLIFFGNFQQFVIGYELNIRCLTIWVICNEIFNPYNNVLFNFSPLLWLTSVDLIHPKKT